MDKNKTSRLRRTVKTRATIRRLNVPRLCVFRTPRHIYAQLIGPEGSSVLASAATVEKDVRKACKKGTGNIDAAKIVGQRIAKQARDVGVTKVAFDRSGYQYHGRVKALAEAARENGLEF